MKSRTTTQLVLASALVATAAFIGCSDDGGGSGAAVGGSFGVGGYSPNTNAPTPKGGALPGGGATGKQTAGVGGGTAAGGATGTGTIGTSTGTSAVACDATPSTVSENATFASAIPEGWAINNWQDVPGADVKQGTTFVEGAASNLCSAGCAILTLPLYAGHTYDDNTVMFQKTYEGRENLLGASISAEVVVTSTLNIPMRVQLFTQAAQVDNWAWGSSSGNEFTSYKDTSKFTKLEIPAVADSSETAYCAALTYAAGIQVQPVGTIPVSSVSGAGGATSTGTTTAAGGGSAAAGGSSSTGGASASSSTSGGGATATGGATAIGGATGLGGATGTGTGAPPVQVGTVTVYIKSITIAPPAK